MVLRSDISPSICLAFNNVTILICLDRMVEFVCISCNVCLVTSGFSSLSSSVNIKVEGKIKIKIYFGA